MVLLLKSKIFEEDCSYPRYILSSKVQWNKIEAMTLCRKLRECYPVSLWQYYLGDYNINISSIKIYDISIKCLFISMVPIISMKKWQNTFKTI